MIIRIQICFFPVSSNSKRRRYGFFLAAAPTVSFRKYLPKRKAATAPKVAATVQQIVPNTGPNSSPARIAKLIPGKAKATLPTAVTTRYMKMAAGRFSTVICCNAWVRSPFNSRPDQPEYFPIRNSKIIPTANTYIFLLPAFCFCTVFLLYTTYNYFTINSH